MDIWMVAVAAGAGCIARHFKNFRKADARIASEASRESSYNVKPESPKQPLDKKQPFWTSEKRENLRQDDFEGVSSAEVTSSSEVDGEMGVFLGNYEGSSVFSTSSSFPGFIGRHNVEGVRVSEGVGDLLHGRLVPRNRSVLRSRRAMGRAIRPLSSLESSLMAQLYMEHVEMKERMSGSYDSFSVQTMRPFFVTNGSEVISRSSMRKTCSEENNAIFGVPPLPNLGSLEISRNDKENVGRDRTRRSGDSSATTVREHFNSQRGSSDATLLLCLGMSFGIISSFMANRREVEKLNQLLKQTESVVQDLQEELDMKDSLTMQELTIENHHSQQTNTHFSNNGSPQSISDEHNNKESVIQKAKDDSFSKIEAELEAELEMLELNMSSSTLERRISNLVELDPGFEPDVAHGELRADMLEDNTDQDGSGGSTTHSANDAVSPRELSLRLHEVLESQLEERIRELEAEIKNKEKQNRKSRSDFLGDENPVVLNLSGEGLDAYNEACNEFAKLDESEEEEEDEWCGDEEMEKMLIKHIVEKARQGSPVVLNAQKALFSE